MKIETVSVKASIDFQSVELEVSFTPEEINNGAIEKLQKKVTLMAYEQAKLKKELLDKANFQTKEKKSNFQANKYKDNKYIGGK